MSDLIRREDVLLAIKNGLMDWEKVGDYNKTLYGEIVNNINALPSAEPERKKGKWIYKPDEYDDSTYECSQCGEPWTLIDGTPEENNMKFCPNCGAEMTRGEHE